MGVAKLNMTCEPNMILYDTKLVSYELRLNGLVSYLG